MWRVALFASGPLLVCFSKEVVSVLSIEHDFPFTITRVSLACVIDDDLSDAMMTIYVMVAQMISSV